MSDVSGADKNITKQSVNQLNPMWYKYWLF